MKEIVYSYTTTVALHIPGEHIRPALQAISLHLAGQDSWPLDKPVPDEVRLAHHTLHTVQHKTVKVNVYSDGSLEIADE